MLKLVLPSLVQANLSCNLASLSNLVRLWLLKIATKHCIAELATKINGTILSLKSLLTLANIWFFCSQYHKQNYARIILSTVIGSSKFFHQSSSWKPALQILMESFPWRIIITFWSSTCLIDEMKLRRWSTTRPRFLRTGCDVRTCSRSTSGLTRSLPIAFLGLVKGPALS